MGSFVWDIVKDFATRLPASLVLILGVNIVAGYFLLRVDPPQTVAFLIIVVLSILMAGLIYHLDQRRLIAEQKRSEAEGEVKGLRWVFEALRKGGSLQDVWTRPMLRFPLKQDAYSDVIQVFDAAIDETCRALSEVPAIKVNRSNVRANVFFPSSENAREGDVCKLTIPWHESYASEHLQRHMEDASERTIAFRPNQGVTGRVFVAKAAVGVLTNPDWLRETNLAKRENLNRWIYVRLHPRHNYNQTPDASLSTESGENQVNRADFGQQFEMSHLQNRLAAERLAWIISMPIFLKVDDDLEIVGVFNVDCLEHQLKPEQLRALFYRLAPFAGALAGVFHGSQPDYVTILRSRE